MLSLQPEIESLRAQLGDAQTDALVARERREVFSVYPELRIAGWLGATMLAAAAGIVLKNNLDRIGPLALAILMGVAAVACYAWTWFRRAKATVVDDSVLLLGALLVAADLAFLESQFRLLGDAWKWHLLILAVVHAIGAYVYDSRMLLSLSITALAGWLGADRRTHPSDLTVPAFECAGLLLAWRALDSRLRGKDDFAVTFEHFAANLALAGSLALMEWSVPAGALLTIAIAAIVVSWGFRTKREAFVLYAFVYAVIAVDALAIHVLRGHEEFILLTIVGSIVGAIVGLIVLHARFRGERG